MEFKSPLLNSFQKSLVILIFDLFQIFIFIFHYLRDLIVFADDLLFDHSYLFFFGLGHCYSILRFNKFLLSIFPQFLLYLLFSYFGLDHF